MLIVPFLLCMRAQQGRPHGGTLRARFVGEQRRLYAQQSHLIAGTLGVPDRRHSRRAGMQHGWRKGATSASASTAASSPLLSCLDAIDLAIDDACASLSPRCSVLTLSCLDAIDHARRAAGSCPLKYTKCHVCLDASDHASNRQ